MDISSHVNTGISGDLSKIFSDYRQQIGLSVNKSEQNAEEQSSKDTVTLSKEGQDLARSQSALGRSTNTNVGSIDTEDLDSQEIQQLLELKQRDTEVRIHEQAHLAAAGQYARGGPSFTYKQGPDGVSYAVGGEVGIDLSKENTPEATITKMQTIKRAALAPASPSGADRSIAAQAGLLEIQARQEALIKSQEELLHADAAENPAVGQEVSSNKDESGTARPSHVYNTLRTVVAVYQRVASY